MANENGNDTRYCGCEPLTKLAALGEFVTLLQRRNREQIMSLDTQSPEYRGSLLDLSRTYAELSDSTNKYLAELWHQVDLKTVVKKELSDRTHFDCAVCNQTLDVHQ